jgi:hypothetical protein
MGQPRHPLCQELGAHGEGVTFNLVHVNALRLKHADAGCQILCCLSVLGHLDEQHLDSTVSLHARVKLDAGIQGGQRGVQEEQRADGGDYHRRPAGSRRGWHPSTRVISEKCGLD